MFFVRRPDIDTFPFPLEPSRLSGCCQPYCFLKAKGCCLPICGPVFTMATAVTVNPSPFRHQRHPPPPSAPQASSPSSAPASAVSPSAHSHHPAAGRLTDSAQSSFFRPRPAHPLRGAPAPSTPLSRPVPLATTTAESPSTSPHDTATPSCDACYRRKSTCAMNGSVNKCYSCDFHRQDCTFTLSNQLGKRKFDETAIESIETSKR